MKCDVWKPCSDQHWQDEPPFWIWRFFGQSAFVNIYGQCYWPTIHNLILKICPKFQVISSHFFEVDELLDEHWAKIVQSENISTRIYVKCDTMLRRCIDHRLVIKNCRISCLALIFNLNNPRTTVSSFLTGLVCCAFQGICLLSVVECSAWFVCKFIFQFSEPYLPVLMLLILLPVYQWSRS